MDEFTTARPKFNQSCSRGLYAPTNQSLDTGTLVPEPLVNTTHFSGRQPMPLGLGLRWGSLLIGPEYSQEIIEILSIRRIGHFGYTDYGQTSDGKSNRRTSAHFPGPICSGSLRGSLVKTRHSGN